MIRTRTRQSLGVLLMLGAAIPGVALAQTQAQPSVSSAVAELVVTAEKRAEPLQEVPLSVTALPGVQLEQIQAVQLRDWSGYVPGLTVSDNGAPGEEMVTIDGVSPIGAASEDRKSVV